VIALEHFHPIHSVYPQAVKQFWQSCGVTEARAVSTANASDSTSRGTLGARCDIEAHNLLALNLAYDVINGKKTAEQARTEFGEIVKAEMAGNKHDYLTKLMFQPMPSAGDADMALMKGKPGEAQTAVETK